MFLKSLSMKGFKSFADSTVLEFEPGITVVVGPNGSGKSNVVDAVTWVLGAQGPRSLRSQKMEDVIFAGTSSRPPLGRAEVSLTIDNSAGKLPLDMSEVTITRTLFRSGDSEYAINGAPCRLLDIQELLSDSGVGRSQHMIIGQGQLDTVLNARPEDRRAVIEEAAGVLKHRRRRERAERRLAATQENLERLGDLVREVRRQIRPLERQAAAARSHASLAADLQALRLHMAGLELVELDRRRNAAASSLETVAGEQGRLQQQLEELDEESQTTAAELSSRRDEELAASLGQVQGLVERARGTRGVLRERTAALAAALEAAADVDVVSNLEADSARLGDDLAAAEREAAALEPERRALAGAEAQLAADELAHRQRWGDGSERQAAADALTRAGQRREVVGRALTQDRTTLEQFERRLASLGQRDEVLATAQRNLAEQAAEAEAEAEQLARDAAAADHELAAATSGAEGAERRAGEADQQGHRTAARAEALARALHELQGTGGREVLAGVEGVVGSLVDLVEIDAGWEAAFEAAAGVSVAAVVVDGRAAARQALDRLYREGATAALLAARGSSPAGPAGAAVAAVAASLPAGAEPLRPHVRQRRGGEKESAVGAVLDSLVGRAVRVAGWEQAIDLALDHPDLVVVTGEGDRFAASGWRVRSGHAVVTAAAVEKAERRADEARQVAEQAAAELTRSRARLDEARRIAREAARSSDRQEAARTTFDAERIRTAEERHRLQVELADVERAREAAAATVAEDQSALDELTAAVPELEAAAAAAEAAAREAATAQAQLDRRRQEVESARQRLEIAAAGLAERRRMLELRRTEVERRLEGHAEERQAAAARRLRLEVDGAALGRLAELVEDAQGRLEALLEVVRHAYSDQVEAIRAGGERLESLRRRRAATERRLGELRQRSHQLELDTAEAGLRAETLVESVERELGASLEEAVAAPLPELPEGVGAAAHAAALTDRLAALGPVNPLALEELSALEERHRELDAQVEDIRRARRELQEVVRTLDAEIMESFAAAAADVNEHFSALVEVLFPGGTGRLSLTDPEDLLGTGVEIEVRPAGRNVRRVSLLSGGERSLAALAFLFAVFRSRPSPFYLMDEVEAALDDVNLHRFLGLVRDFREEAQLIVVSHQKRTMETADALYGVTMAPGGSTQVVSQKLAQSSELSALSQASEASEVS